MKLFFSLFIIFFFGFFGGYLFEKIRIPKIVFYLLLGILMGPSALNIASEELISISSHLRQIALVIILTRSGLSLDLTTLKKIGRPAVLMCFVPASFEILGIAIFGPMLLGISYFEALLLGSVLAAVSPAIVAPRMIRLMQEGYGVKHHVPELVLAGASCDDIFVIVLFYSFKSLVKNNVLNVWTLSQIPISIVSGILLGVILGVLFNLILSHVNINIIGDVVILLGVSFGMIALEDLLKSYFSISSLLGIITMSILVRLKRRDKAEQIQKSYNSLWSAFEILLFTLVGIATEVSYAISKEGAIIIGLVFIGLVFRTIGVILSILFTEYSFKEKLFIVISYLPKATVQASIGGIALSENLACGTTVLTAAVIAILITAPLGALLMDNLYKKLLMKEVTLSIDDSVLSKN